MSILNVCWYHIISNNFKFFQDFGNKFGNRLRGDYLKPSQLHNALLCLTKPYYAYFYHRNILFSSTLHVIL